VPRAVSILLPAALAAVSLAACGSKNPGTPVACLAGPAAFERALQTVPTDVTLGGKVKISDCLTQGQAGGELAQVGSAMVEVATKLNAELGRSNDAAAASRLGFLVGAARKGSEANGGEQADLVRRLESAATLNPGGGPLPGRVGGGYETGLAQGEADG